MSASATQYGIASFRSRQQVINFDQRLREAGVRAQIVSTPRDISIGCGLSVRFNPVDAARVLAVLKQYPSSNLTGVYILDPAHAPKLTPLRW